MNEKQERINYEVFNALTDVLFNHRDDETEVTIPMIMSAVEWFELHINDILE